MSKPIVPPIGPTTGTYRYGGHRDALAALEAGGFTYAPEIDRWIHQDGREAASRGLLDGNPGAVVAIYSPDEPAAPSKAKTLEQIALARMGIVPLEGHTDERADFLSIASILAALDDAYEAGRKAGGK